MNTVRDPRLTIASVNLSGAGAADDRRQVLAGLVQAELPQVVLCQQVPGEKPDDIYRDLPGMTAVAVRRAPPQGPAGGPAHHTAILVRSSPGLDIAGTGPEDVPWSEALLTVASIPYPVRFYSTWLPENSELRQRQYARLLAGRVTALARAGNELAFAGGNWNCLAPADNYTQAQLRRMPERSHLAAVSTCWDGTIEPVLDVHDELDEAGLADVAALVAPRHRYPPELRPTGRGGRTCRAYATRDLAKAADSYQQDRSATGDVLLVMTINLAEARTRLHRATEMTGTRAGAAPAGHDSLLLTVNVTQAPGTPGEPQ